MPTELSQSAPPSLSRQALYAVLTTIQNVPRYANVDIMTIAGLHNHAELVEHVWSNFSYLPVADQRRALETLNAQVSRTAEAA